MIPEKGFQNLWPSQIYNWSIRSGNGRGKIPFEAYFMDYAKTATEFGKDYFECEDFDGVEAEDSNKIHLSEYIFGVIFISF